MPLLCITFSRLKVVYGALHSSVSRTAMMNNTLMMALVACAFFLPGNAAAKGQAMSDAKVKEQIIAESIAAYPGVCACPFNRARNGSACGRRSAWSKAGGYAPVCYKDEITAEMVKQWREQNAG